MRVLVCACIVASFAVARGSTGQRKGSRHSQIKRNGILQNNFRRGTAASEAAYSICKISHPTALDTMVLGSTSLSNLLTTIDLDHEVKM